MSRWTVLFSLALAGVVSASPAKPLDRELAEIERSFLSAPDDPGTLAAVRERLIELEARDPARQGLWSLWGRVGSQAKRYDDAVLGLRVARRRGNESVESRALLARSLFQWGIELSADRRKGKDKLLRIFTQSLEITREAIADPETTPEERVVLRRLSILGLTNVAAIHRWFGNFPEALALFRELAALEPENYRHRMNLARVQLGAQKFEAALAEVEEARKLRGGEDWLGSHALLAEIHSNLGHDEAAERHYASFLAERPDDPPVLRGLGEHYLRTGKFGPAAEIFLRLTELTPRDKRVYSRLATALRRLGRVEEADEYMEIYRKLNRTR